MSLLSILSHVLVYEDSVASNNPSMRPVDWKKGILNIPVRHGKSDPLTIPAQTEVTIFDTGVSTAIDGTTAFSLGLSSLDSTTYRITHTGGTAPAFRTARVAVVSPGTVAVAALPNNLVTFTHSGTPFGTVVAGDTVFVPGILTGDPTGPFNSLNEGYWTVVSATTSVLTLARFPGDSFQAFPEGPVTIAANSDIQIYSASGIQLGDTVDISAGCQLNARKSFVIVGVTATRIEIQSTLGLATETGIIPTASGMLFYRSSKRLLYIETDQEAVVRVNGDTSSTNKMSPWTPGEAELRAQYLKVGSVWKLSILNKATVPAEVIVITAE